MNKVVHLFVILSMLLCPLCPVQAALPANDSEQHNFPAPAINSYDTSAYQQSFESDPQYYISLRWLVYMLILSLPIAPVQTPPPGAAASEKS